MSQDDTASKFYINGFGRFSPKARLFAAQASISSRVAEGFQAELLEDSRVALHYSTLFATLADEMRWVVDLGDSIWEALGRVCGSEGYLVQDSTIAAAHTTFHFIWRRVMQRAASYPWKLVRGDIEENLQALQALDEPPAEPVTSQLWTIMNEHDTVPREQLVRVVELLGQAPWTSLPAEQQHGSLAMLRRWHHEYSTETLVSRALIHQGVRILPSLSEDEKKLAALTKQLGVLVRKDPSKTGPKSMLVQALYNVARGKKDLFLQRRHKADTSDSPHRHSLDPAD